MVLKYIHSEWIVHFQMELISSFAIDCETQKLNHEKKVKY